MFKDVIQLIGITPTHIPYLFCALQGIPDFTHFTLHQSIKIPMLIKQGLAFVFQFVIRKKKNKTASKLITSVNFGVAENYLETSKVFPLR